MRLTRYKYIRHQTEDGYISDGLEPRVDGEWVKADEVRAVLTAYIQRGERLLNDLIDTSDSAESFRYWIEELKKEIAP